MVSLSQFTKEIRVRFWISTFLVILGCALGAAQPSFACGKKSLGKSGKRETVALTGTHVQPSYYWRTELGDVMFFSADDVVASFQGLSPTGAAAKSPRGKLLAAIERDQPLSGHTDLLKYALENRELATPLEFMTGALLATGKVSFDRWNGFQHSTPDPQPKTIEMVSQMAADDNFATRWFCLPDGRPLLTIYNLFAD